MYIYKISIFLSKNYIIVLIATIDRLSIFNIWNWFIYYM